MPEAENPTVSDAFAALLKQRGVQRIYGVPGGDCNLDIIDSAERVGIEFVLTRSETPATLMAAATAEVTGTLGVAMTTRGPGLANAALGVSYAALDRAAVMLIADAYEADLEHVSHQRFDQAALLAPLTKASGDLEGATPIAGAAALIATATSWPPGPVYLEITGKAVRAAASANDPVPAAAVLTLAHFGAADELARARELIGAAKKPAFIVGLQARDDASSAMLRTAVAEWGCPVFTTYKAKGVADDSDPFTLGHFIGGAAEYDALSSADLIVLYGFDPIEQPPQRWQYDVPIVELTVQPFDRTHIAPTVSVVADIAASLQSLLDGRSGSDWTTAELADLKAAIRARASASLIDDSSDLIAPELVATAAIEAFAADTRITVDAGAFMLPVLHLWSARSPRDVLVSRGIATMGFALPAAIGAALADPDRLTVAFTGDGGLMMCTAELGTAVQQNCKLVVVVFNDENLTLIGAKQARRKLPAVGVAFSPANFASVADGFGLAAFRVEHPDELLPALRAAAESASGGRPALVDVRVDPSPYYDEIIALRG